MKSGSQKIVYVINHAAFFVSHRLPLALGAMARGYSVALITGRAGSDSMESSAERVLRSHGIEHHRVSFTAAGMNPFVEARGLFQLVRLLRRMRPDIVHCASPKGILYGSIGARLSGVRGIVLAVSGMGFAFTSAGRRSVFRSLAAFIYRLLARFAYGHPNKTVIVQNTEDRELIVGTGLATTDQVVLIPGSGVELRRFAQAHMERKQPIVLFAARMVADKGVMELIEAARIVRRSLPEWRFVMAGAADYENPSSIPADLLQGFNDEGVIEWRGLVDDMDSLYAQASIVCLPSYYREGMPKTLLEAAAAGCAVVTTDLPGCREAIIPGETGDLVPAKDAAALAVTLMALMGDRQRREAYGAAGRVMAAERFSIDAVIDRVIRMYLCLAPETGTVSP
jgi:glycosyltransferase involved in cell wall biosynthesis